MFFSVELDGELLIWEKAFQTATFLEVERIQVGRHGGALRSRPPALSHPPPRPVPQCKTYACIMESHLMGLTVDFSMGFVCFDAASKVGVPLHSVRLWGGLLSNFSVLPADAAGRSPSQSAAPRRLPPKAHVIGTNGNASAAILFRECWPPFLEASAFLKDAALAARVLFTRRNAETGIHMSSAAAGSETPLIHIETPEPLLADFSSCSN